MSTKNPGLEKLMDHSMQVALNKGKKEKKQKKNKKMSLKRKVKIAETVLAQNYLISHCNGYYVNKETGDLMAVGADGKAEIICHVDLFLQDGHDENILKDSGIIGEEGCSSDDGWTDIDANMSVMNISLKVCSENAYYDCICRS